MKDKLPGQNVLSSTTIDAVIILQSLTWLQRAAAILVLISRKPWKQSSATFPTISCLQEEHFPKH